ncbi:unnamed protein product [Somion occarium]|uniref:Uncharacterized protein n=1 Tax=Somion occarium TaxID=3059160 RepID=A0ABP1DAG5_9APHY
MSRLTAAQLIAQGEYLEPDFDPSTLTVSQLLGVFGYHNINYPSQYTKVKLIQLFNDEVKPKGNKFKKQRLKRENSQASDDGITDGLTGKPIGDTKPVRRSSRRISRTPSQVPQPEPETSKLEPPKRRRSSAEPALGGPSRRRTAKPTQPVLMEESEPEELPIRKVSRSKKSSADAGSQARRVSESRHTEDSGWEDNNIFQSGAESSSPGRPSPVRPRVKRPSGIPTRSRKSLSAPPDYVLDSPTKDKGKARVKPIGIRAPSVKPPESSFEPVLPPEVIRETRSTTAKASRATDIIKRRKDLIVEVPDDVEEVTEPSSQSQEVRVEKQAITEEQAVTSEVPFETEVEPEAEGEWEEFAEGAEQVRAVSQRISEGGQLARRGPEAEPTSMSLFLRLLIGFLLVTGPIFLFNYKQESAPIGFCETGKSTNTVLERLQAKWSAIESCNRANSSLLYSAPDPYTTGSVDSPVPTQTAVEMPDDSEQDQVAKSEPCPPLPLVPVPHPSTCAPCPPHASCTPSSMTCETGYLIRPHPALFFLRLPTNPSPATSNPQQSYMLPYYSDSLTPADSISQTVYKYISLALDGFPGLGPVAFPPRCVEDPRRRRHIGVLGRAVESILAQERGRRLCSGEVSTKPSATEAEEARKWGIELEELKDSIRNKTSSHLLDTFEDTFNEAIQQIVQYGGVMLGEDAEGKRYLAHRTPQMDWACTLRVKARESWLEWQKQIISTLLLILSILAFRRRRAQAEVENARVASLVQIALDLLRNQELAHHTDPITAPQPYLSSLQLRDLILQDEHSVRARKRLWGRVERVVEGNANVRTNLEEVDGGDELRVWRWVGSTGRTLSGPSGVKRFAVQADKAESTVA